MRTSFIKPLKLEEESFDVSLLHTALAALGLPVAKPELTRGQAGQDTVKKVRALQEQLHLPVDESVLVDSPTAAAIENSLQESGLTADTRAFVVSGTVRQGRGEVRKRQKLLAFDLDLRGVAVFRRVSTLAEIRKNEGFQFLGDAYSNRLGQYRILFYDWQYRRAERKKADVVVYAVADEDIVGRSGMANSEDYSETGVVRDLDVFISKADERTEYDRLMGRLTAFMRENKTRLGDIAGSRDQLVFTAGELDEDVSRIRIAAAAERLITEEKPLSHELLYGIGRQNIRLSWAALYKRPADQLRTAIERSAARRIIDRPENEHVTGFLQTLKACATAAMLAETDSTLGITLRKALPGKAQRIAYLNALRDFRGADFREFWNDYLPSRPEFKDAPELVDRVLLIQQLTLLTGNHPALVAELQESAPLTSADRLMDLAKQDWLDLIEKSGVPDFIQGESEAQKRENYAGQMQHMLNAAFPTRRIAKMLDRDELPIEKTRVVKSIRTFLSQNPQFDFADARIHDYSREIEAAAGEAAAEVNRELMRLQRVFQVSPHPEAMAALLENKLDSAHAVAAIPRKGFIAAYGPALGGAPAALALHQRASHISARAQMNAVHLMEYTHGALPGAVMGSAENSEIAAALENKLPNYSELFGSPDICECEHCRSVYSAAAYFVDLLRFLWRAEPNSEGQTPLQLLTRRRLDLLHLPLTCENTNTLIPYIDLANEVMEFYVANDSLSSFKGHDTGDTTADELRANPQHFNLEAYRTLAQTGYPFTLPFHQPLDVIRTYSEHLGVSRYDAMTAVNPQADAAATRALAAESLALSHEQYAFLTGEAFGGSPDPTPLHEFFGYGAAGELEQLSDVREFLKRTGVAYPELVALVETRFINPHQDTLEFLQALFSHSAMDAAALYAKLTKIEAATLDPANDTDIVDALNDYNNATGTGITTGDFAQWVMDHLGDFRQVITLYEPQSKCDLDTTRLRTLQSIYENLPNSGIPGDTWSRMHRFIRLWRQLGWTLHQTDLVLAALGDNDITPDTVGRLGAIAVLKRLTRRPLDQLATLWGNIDRSGKKSLYAKLFLNRAVQQIDPAFKADAWGNYLQDAGEILADHRSAILAAFRISEEDLSAVLASALVIDNGTPRHLDPGSDALSIENLSTIYRYVVLAKSLRMRVADMCILTGLFDMSPFSTWDIQQNQFIHISPQNTIQFFTLAAAAKSAGFKPAVLDYIFNGTAPAGAAPGLDRTQTLQTARAIRAAFAAIEQAHPAVPALPLTAEILTAKLSLTFQADAVSRLMEILEDSALFETITDDNLNVTIPEDLAPKYTYVNGSGRLSCTGIMTDDERNTLKGLANATVQFKAAVDRLYAAPEDFLGHHFDGVFSDLTAANAILLDHPAQAPAATFEQKLSYVYDRFLPILKDKLQRDALVQHLAALIGLGEAATALLTAADLAELTAELSIQGFSGSYFNDPQWSALALERVDPAIDFAWQAAAPDPLVTADNFSVQWKAYLTAPASGQYTLQVAVAEADEAFKLYLDDVLILEKPALDPNTSWEVVTELDAARMHLLTVAYAEASQNAGIRLYWKTEASAREIVPAAAAYPATILDNFAARAGAYHRAAKFILGFDLSDAELDHLIRFGADFDHIDFKALTTGHWVRIQDYMTLRNSVPQAQALLTEVFALAATPQSPPTMDQLIHRVHLATAWDKPNLEFLAAAYFNLSPDDFKNEKALLHLQRIMQIRAKTGLSAQTITRWGAAETDFDLLHATAQLIKNAVKAKYEIEDWLDVAGRLSDTVRENQQQALVDYLLTRPAIQSAGVADADGLFEHFLIDVQMSACMETSRIVQANAAVQMFVNRCLLNLESDMSSGSETGVSPGAIDKHRWEWMKNYRVWEANRKVFLYPENWLEPEWRFERSELFKGLESHMVQTDITPRSVEQGFRDYLTGLNQVAHLEVCGMHQENDPKGKIKYLHVFARTHNLPHQFFYRRWNQYRKWSAWESVAVDIPAVGDLGHSGVHLIPVVWKQRLFLFWPEFMDFPEPPSGMDSQSVEGVKNQKIAELTGGKYWQVKLAWSERVDGQWQSKQVSKEAAVVPNWYVEYVVRKARVSFYANISPGALSIKMWNNQYLGVISFNFSDIQSEIEVKSPLSQMGPAVVHETSDDPAKYYPAFMKRAKYHSAQLELMDDLYLENYSRHRLLFSDDGTFSENKIRHPFFFSDAFRTYFVRPVSIKIYDWIRNPGTYRPFFPDIPVDDSGFAMPIEIPDVGPDDYLPAGMIQARAGQLPAADAPMTAMSAPLGPGRAASPTTTGMPEDGLTPYAKNYGKDATRVEAAFGLDASLSHAHWGRFFRLETGLEFHTFYHPFAGAFVTSLNQGGLEGLMESDTRIAPDQGDLFETTYGPNFSQGFVKRHSLFDTPPDPRTAYTENVCFDIYGANSLYNRELFFDAPLYIATRLSANGKYAEAMQWFHYIFDPTTDDMPGPGESEISRYWKVLPFKTTHADTLENWFASLSPNGNPNTENMIIGEWRDNPFDPHRVAGNRPIAYMKHVVVKYVKNLIDWGDALYRQFTRESVYEALQLYVLANHILGPRPEFVPKRGKIKAETYFSLQNKWDDFSNALVELENIFPYSSEAPVDADSPGPQLLGIGPTLYFCIPPNDKLLESWDTVADRLFKIRHCQDIDGVERQLALFAPPIDPAALIQALSQGLSLGSVLADLSSPPPIYRFTYLIQKAYDFCGDVRALGAALLAVLEKKDAEELNRLRASHETQILETVTAIKERQILDAKVNKEGLLKVRDQLKFQLQHFNSLLGNSVIEVPDAPTLSATLNAHSQLPADTGLAPIPTDVDASLSESDETGVKLIPRETEELEQAEIASDQQDAANVTETIGKALYFIPQFTIASAPWGAGTLNVVISGTSIGLATSAVAAGLRSLAEMNLYDSGRAGKLAAYIRREQDWTLQANLAAKEIIHLDKQITSADIRIQVAEKDLANHQKQIENAKETALFLQDKFTNQELYQWMKEQLFAVYKQSYNLAYDMAKKAEKALQYEMASDTAGFIRYGYWDNSKQGLVAGEKLQLALRQLEKSYLEENRRELELFKSVSLDLLNPLALIQLKETGQCYVSLPEALFDLDFPGHYFRRIKSVSVSIPSVAGPYTSVSCSLRLLKNTTRMNTTMNSQGNYEHENDEGLWIDDDRFRSSHVPVTSIATSSAQDDSGMFEFNFRDERYLPFEGAGVISDWMLELSTEKAFRQFDYTTISDVILHIKYTARESGGLFKEKATAYLKDFLTNVAELGDQPLMRMFSMRHEFPTEWYKFLHPDAEAGEQVLAFTMGIERFPFFTHHSGIVIMKMEVLAKCLQQGDYHTTLSYINTDDDPVASSQISMPQNSGYGGLQKATLNATDAGLNLEELDIGREMTLKLKHSAAPDYKGLAADEVEDIFLVFHYKLAPED